MPAEDLKCYQHQPAFLRLNNSMQVESSILFHFFPILLSALNPPPLPPLYRFPRAWFEFSISANWLAPSACNAYLHSSVLVKSAWDARSTVKKKGGGIYVLLCFFHPGLTFKISFKLSLSLLEIFQYQKQLWSIQIYIKRVKCAPDSGSFFAQVAAPHTHLFF